jgi:isorenieratene synthase
VTPVLRSLAQRISGSRPTLLVAPEPGRPTVVDRPVSAAVVGGGIAGVTAALLLAERGVQVTLLERAPQLGGRLSAWPHTIADGSEHLVEHGFHGFFRQYYNWRAVLRRIDPHLCFLRPLASYPIVSREWPDEDFTGLPGVPPLNLAALVLRSPSLPLRELRSVDGDAATPLLSCDPVETYRAYDGMSAAQLLDSLRMPPRARAVLFDVFAHSFFNAEDEMSAAEMIMMFHFYFLRNPEGLDIDAPDQDFETAIWAPLAAQLRAHGADLRVNTQVSSLDVVDSVDARWRLTLGDGSSIEADEVVLAADPASTRELVLSSDSVRRAAPRLAADIATVATTAPYAVARLWLDRDCAPGRPTFAGVSQEATLDSISVYSRLERASAHWARRTGGSIIELHAYAAPDGPDADELADRMTAELHALWPETAAARVIDRDARVGRDAPAFGLGSDATRPGVRTDAAGLYLAGDWVRMPFPSALMERSASSAILAVNAVSERYGVRSEPVWSVPPRGLLAGRSLQRPRRSSASAERRDARRARSAAGSGSGTAASSDCV